MQPSVPAILIIDSDRPTLELYQRELSHHYQIFACSEVQQALALLQAHPISAVVLEPSAPDDQGWSLLADIKRLPGPASVPVVLCTTLDERKRGMEMGVAAYLIKPVLPVTLLEVLRKVTHLS